VLKPIDRCRYDGRLYPGSSKTQADLIDPTHLLRRIDATVDVAALAEFLPGKFEVVPWQNFVHRSHSRNWLKGGLSAVVPS
jgi:hypothetical protein